MDSIRIKRGAKANLPNSLPLGELAFCTDTGELYVGTGHSVKKVIDAEINDLVNHLEQSKRNKSDLITRHDLDTSKEDSKIRLINLADEVRQAMTGNTATLPVIEDGDVTSEKLANQSVTYTKLDNMVANAVNSAKMLNDIYSNTGEIAQLQVKGSYASNPIYRDNLISFTPVDSGSDNSAIYFNTKKMEVKLSSLSSPTFIVLNTNDQYIYSIRMDNIMEIAKHEIYNFRLNHTMPNIECSKAITTDMFSFENTGKSIIISQKGSVLCTLTETDYPELFDGDSNFGFLVTKGKTATLEGVAYVNFPHLGLFDIARDSDLKIANLNITNLKEQAIKFEDMHLDLYGNNENTWRKLELKDFYKKDCVIFDGILGTIKISDTLLTEKYDWYCLKPHITKLEGTWSGADNWLVLKVTDEKALALNCVDLLSCRVFTNSGKVQYHSATIINENAKLQEHDKFRVYEKSSNVFTIEVMKNNTWLQWLELDVNSIPSINEFTLGYGTIVYEGNLGRTMYTDVTIFTESYTGMVSELSDTIENTKKNTKDISEIKEIISNGDIDVNNSKVVDLVMFMGQSNMAGRGVASESPVVPVGHGYEFRAISDPTKLYDIVEPFGVNENNSSSGVSETTKTGSMVSSFVSNYYKATKVPIVAVSCAKGGTKISWWQPNGGPLNDAINRHNLAKEWLIRNGYIIRHDFMVWCQGCSDGDNGTTSESYQTQFKLMVEEMMKHGVEKCFMVRIGNHRDNPTIYDTIISAQTELGKTYENVVLVSTKLSSMATDGLMKDQFHYKQEGYNIVGKDAGINTAFYINNLKEPTMYDWENQNLYFSHKN